jgi:hypothetical protein
MEQKSFTLPHRHVVKIYLIFLVAVKKLLSSHNKRGNFQVVEAEEVSLVRQLSADVLRKNKKVAEQQESSVVMLQERDSKNHRNLLSPLLRPFTTFKHLSSAFSMADLFFCSFEGCQRN